MATISKNQRQSTDRHIAVQLLLKAWKGELLPYHFFQKNFFTIAAIMAMILVTITAKYTAKSQLREISTLRSTLQVEQAERIAISAEYNSKVRESALIELVDTMNVNLVLPDQPPFLLK